MSGGNDSNRGGGSNDDGGWGSKFLKVAGAAAATAAVAGGLYALLASSASGNSQPEVPFGARRVHDNEADDDDDPPSLPQETPSSQVGWTKPEFGWVKLNVDGSCVHGVSAGCGGVLRDASGAWLHGFAQRLDPGYQPHKTEIQAILTGLQLASEMKEVKKLVVESDNDSVVYMVENGVGDKHPQFDYVSSIRQLCLHPKWQVRLVSIPRAANGVANKLARDACDLPSHDLREYPSPPDNCIRLLSKDAPGVSF